MFHRCRVLKHRSETRIEAGNVGRIYSPAHGSTEQIEKVRHDLYSRYGLETASTVGCYPTGVGCFPLWAPLAAT